MLQVKNISFSYTENIVLDGISFQVEPGEYTAVIGESGSGKSTLLKLLYGENDLNKGHVYWKNEEVLGPKHNLVVGYDFIKYVAQEFELMPFISVEENVGKFLSNFFPEEKKERINELLEVVELTDFAKTKVKLLSGGQKQRVALARALAKQPEIIFLDEPFSHIDSFKKQSLRRKLFEYLKEHGIACVAASHDKDDVLGHADSILVLHNAKIIASGKPETLYKNPKNSLIASFFGEFNVINDTIIYAHQLKAVERSNIQATVKKCYFKGNYYLIEAKLNNQTIFFEHPSILSENAEVNIMLQE